MALVGCGSTSTRTTPAPTTTTVATGGVPSDSPLTGCVDATPKTRPLPGVSGDFSDGRVAKTLNLDDGRFEAEPPADTAHPAVGRSNAFCNLLAGVNRVNGTFAGSAVAFGLAKLTVDPSLATDGQDFTAIGPDGKPIAAPEAHLTPYRSRLAWIAVFAADDLVTSCPPMPVSPTTATPPSTTAPNGGETYEIMAVDAATGANGILYTTTSANPCGQPGFRAPSYQPAKIRVSLPWKLVSRGPGASWATISYTSRPCDDRTFTIDTATNLEAVLLDRDHPGVVDVTLERTLTTCGPDEQVKIPLRSAMPGQPLPEKLTHAPVGAVDTSD